MGEVYRAKDIRLDREVAINVLPADFANVLPADFANDADLLKRFEQESRAISALNHPNILTIHDVRRRTQPRAIARRRSHTDLTQPMTQEETYRV